MEKRVLRVGDKASYVKTITKADVHNFAAVTGDFCPIHLDEDFAKNTRFGRTISHGLLVSNLLSTIMGMKMPGPGTLFIEEHVKFLLPTFPGDTITAELTVTNLTEKKNGYIAEFKGYCRNQRGETVVEAEEKQMLSKELFTVE
ncbi:MAG: MaoC family dehydratase [Fusobacteriaceae bacterium]|jgi:acyl dehydratase|nr:MaoC family dehydratase [Fusobacteriaceae bacterium]